MISGLSTVLILYGGVLVVAEILYYFGVKADLTRKIVHIGGGIISALLPFFVSLGTAVALGAFLFLILF